MKAVLAFAPIFARIGLPIAATLALSLVALVAGIALLGVSGWFLTAAALTSAGAAFNLFGPSAGVRALSFIRILARYGEKLTGHGATLKLLSELRHWLFEKLFPIAPFGRRFGRADLVSRLTADIDALDTLFLLALGPVTTAIVAGSLMSIWLGYVLPSAAVWYALAFALAGVGVPVALVALSRSTGARVLAASAELRASILDGIDGHQDLVVFGAVDRTRSLAETAAHQLGKERRRLGNLGALAGGAIQLLAGAATLATLVAGLGALTDGGIHGPLLAGVLLAVVASFEACALLVRSAARLAGAAAAAERLHEVVARSAAVADSVAPVIAGPGGSIAFDAVRFGYDARRPVLDDLNFSVATGECVAIRGPSGSGKSTIAQLLARLADPQSGAIRLNGVDVRDLSQPELRRRVSLMTQDAPVFLDSVRENLRIGDPAALDGQLVGALETVGLAAFVADLSRGLDTLLGEAGRTLSAGQARRLCLARSLLSQADVLVLDEPTTGLDAEAEAAFLVDLRRAAAGRTVIVITHAPLPRGSFDRVLSLRSGGLSENQA